MDGSVTRFDRCDARCETMRGDLSLVGGALRWVCGDDGVVETFPCDY